MHNVALFGEALADIFPDATVLGGAPYNVARHLRAFQQHPVLITRLGADTLKNQLLSEFSRLQMDMAGIQIDPAYPTGQVKVEIRDRSHHFDICSNQAYDYIDTKQAIASVKSTKPSLIYFGTLAQRHAVSSATLAKLLADSTGIKFCDINLRSPWYNKAIIENALFKADIVKVNDEELSVIANIFTFNTSDYQAQALLLVEKFCLTTLFVTFGEEGAWAISNTGEILTNDGKKLTSSCIDTVGAGDAFSAITILGTLYHWPLTLTLNRATRFASEICQLRGAAPEKNNFYSPFIEEWELTSTLP